MATIGKPDFATNNGEFSKITMSRGNPNGLGGPGNQLNEDQLNKVTGYRPKSIYGEKKPNELGKEEFLKLLSHQIQHQDPTKPMDHNQMAMELAQFSQVEQLTNINKTLSKQEENFPIQNKFYAASFLGKEIITNGITVDHKGDTESSDINFFLKDHSKNIIVRVFDQKGSMVAQMEREDLPSGAHTIPWNGDTLDGGTAGAGRYNIKIMAFDKFNQPIELDSKTVGVVDGVFFENGHTILNVKGKKINLQDVESFHIPQPAVVQKPIDSESTSKSQESLIPKMNNVSQLGNFSSGSSDSIGREKLGQP